MIILLKKPLELLKDNYLEFITEFLTTIYLLFYLLLTDITAFEINGEIFDASSLKILSSWGLVGLLFVALAVGIG